MSWNMPTKKEAAEEYSRSKTNYSNAAHQRSVAQRWEDDLRYERARTEDRINSCISDRLNFEERIQQIHQIIDALEGTGSGFLPDVPEEIHQQIRSAEITDTSFQQSIRCDGIAPASFVLSFQCKTVNQDSNTQQAIELFEKEVQRLEQAIEDINNQMHNMMEMIDDLTSQIQNSIQIQMDCRKAMINSSFEMSHFRKWM